jgi:H+/Cl- antiporter ClcA
MRLAIALLALLGVAMAGNLATPILAAANSGYVVALAQQPGQYSVDINVNDSGAWWMNPLWIGIGVVALVLLIVIVALAARGGGTTVIKE